jgi:hypothetical protein
VLALILGGFHRVPLIGHFQMIALSRIFRPCDLLGKGGSVAGTIAAEGSAHRIIATAKSVHAKALKPQSAQCEHMRAALGGFTPLSVG